MNLRDRARRLFGREPLSLNAVVSSKVENAVFRDVCNRSTAVSERVSNPPELPDGATVDAETWSKLSEDVWSEFYGLSEPTVRPRNKVAPSAQVNRSLADKNARSERFEELHATTRGDVTTSALAWLSAMDSFAQSYGDELAEHGELAERAKSAERTVEDIDNALASLRQQRQNAPGGDRTVEHIDQLIRDNIAAKREAAAEMAEIQGEMAQSAGDLVTAAKAAVQAAGDAAKETVETVGSLPGAQAGGDHTLSVDQALEFAARVHDSSIIAQVLDMMGRIEIGMSGKRRELRKGGYEEMVDIETGDDLRLVLPHERALLTHPVARLDFYRRFHERSLMQYEMWSEEELKKGPLVFCTDGSGSMSGAKNVFARGLTLACCLIAHREGRNSAAIEFGAAGELRTFFFPKDEPFSTATAMDFAEHFFGGGTHTDGAIAHGLALIEDESPFHTADMVVVADGQDHVSAQTTVLRDELRELNVSLHGIAIGLDPTAYLLHVCDTTSSVFDYAGPNSTSDRLAIDIS